MFSNLITKAYADTTVGRGTPMDGKTLVTNIVDNIVNPIIALMVAVAVIIFLWGAFQFIRNAESPDERQKGGMTMLWGVIGLFIMASAYGILNLIIGTIEQ
jgi:hypothetical protein